MLALIVVLLAAGGATPAAAVSVERPAVPLQPIPLPASRAFPESFSIGRDGTFYIGSAVLGGIQKIRPGSATVESWIAPGTFGTRGTFGVLADDNAGVVWVCSGNLSEQGIASPGSGDHAYLVGFDMLTAKATVRVELPGSRALCNDIAVAPDGTVYVSDEGQGRILQLSGDRRTLRIFASGALLGDINGLAFGSDDGALYGGIFKSGALVKITSSGEITLVPASRRLRHPDGIRAIAGNALLVAEADGSLARVTITGSRAIVQTLKDGLLQPSSVAEFHGIAWVAQGQIGILFDPTHAAVPHLPFQIVPVPLSATAPPN